MKSLKQMLSGLLRAESGRVKPAPELGYVGRFRDWREAKNGGAGYQDPAIAQKVALGARAVLSGAAVYERDSVTFERRAYSFPVATALLWAASGKSAFRVLDFGGGLGTSYFQNEPFLRHVDTMNWDIVEQPSFVAQGVELFKGRQPRFIATIEEGLAGQRPDIALFSSALQYVEAPYGELLKASSAEVELLVIDRTLFSEELADYATRQHVPAQIFEATIPLWIFSRQKLLDFMAEKYALLAEFPASQSTATWDSEGRNLRELGFIFALKGSRYDIDLR